MFCHFIYYCYICSGNQRYSTMARPISDETAHKVTLHINNGYRYATLRPRVTNEATGKRMNKSIHLGTVTESLKFIPIKYANVCLKWRKGLSLRISTFFRNLGRYVHMEIFPSKPVAAIIAI